MAADEEHVETLDFTPQLDVDGTPYVNFTWGEQVAGFSTTAARRAALALLEAAEQADLEHAMWEWLLTDSASVDVPIDERRARVAQILAGFRRHRDQPEPFTPNEET